MFAKPLHKALESRVIETATRRQMRLVIRESDEAIAVMERGFMHTPNRPLARALQTAADALAARQLEGADRVEATQLGEHHRTIDALIGREWVVARHLQPPAASHGSGCGVGGFGALHPPLE